MKSLKLIEKKVVENLYYRLVDQIYYNNGTFKEKLQLMRTLLEGLFKEATRNAEYRLSTLDSRMFYILEEYRFSKEDSDQLFGLKYWMNEATHKLKVDKINQELFDQCVHTLMEIMRTLSGVEPPEELCYDYGKVKYFGLRQPNKQTGECLKAERVVVMGIRTYKKVDGVKVELSHRGSPYVLLRCRSVRDGQEFKVRLGVSGQWQNDLNENRTHLRYGQDFVRLGREIQKFQTIQLFDLGLDPQFQEQFNTHAQSRIIVEPDYLIHISKLAYHFVPGEWKDEHIYFPGSHLRSLMEPFSPHAGFLRGNIVNNLFDRFLDEGEFDLRQGIREELVSQVWAALCLPYSDILKIGHDVVETDWNSVRKTSAGLMQGKGLIEPSFIADQIGLEGRLDLLEIDMEQPDFKNVYDIKSKRAPKDKTTAHAKDEMQLHGYNLLMEAVYGPGRRGHSAVIYTQEAKEQKRLVARSRQSEQDLLMARNLYLCRIFQLASGNLRAWQRLYERPPEWRRMRKDQKKSRENFEYLWSTLDEAERDYLAEMGGYLFRELQTAKVGLSAEYDSHSLGFSAFWNMNRTQKRKAYRLLDRLTYAAVEDKNDSKILVFNRTEQVAARFRDGDMAMIYADDGQTLTPTQQQILKCSILEVGPHLVKIRLNHPLIDPEFFNRSKYWAIEPGFSEKGTVDQFTGLMSLMAAEKDKRDLFLGRRAPRFKAKANYQLDAITSPEDYGTLTDSQAEALALAMKAEDYLLIQGPPGTGKTSRLMMNILLQTRRARPEETVFILAFTNRAVEKILRHCEDYQQQYPDLNFVHIARATSDSPHTLIAKVGKEVKVYDAGKQLLKQTRIFVGTVHSYFSHRKRMPQEVNRDLLLVDEASQLTEPMLAGILPDFKRFILIGDHNQLPPITVQPAESCVVEKPRLKDIGIERLDQSLFHRLWQQAKDKEKNSKNPDWAHATIMLKEHFRMHDDIAGFVQPYYQGKLKSQLITQRALLEPLRKKAKDPLVKLLDQHRLIFVESNKGENKLSQEESSRVVQLVAALKVLHGKNFKSEEDVGIITPWRTQIDQIQRDLVEAGHEEAYLVDTVERFQGQEKNTIILSLATSGEYLMDLLRNEYVNFNQERVDRKLNVSVSRAQNRLIVLGEQNTLKDNLHYRRLMEYIRTHGCYLDTGQCSEYFSEVQSAPPIHNTGDILF